MEVRGRLMPVFLLLLLLPEPAASGCASSLGYKFTITLNGQPWCVIQGQVNGKNFFNYTCNHQEIKFMGGQGMEVNETQAWNQQRDTLKDVMEDLRMILHYIKWNISTSGPLSLQGSMMCKQESSGGTSASWEFDFVELPGAAGGEVSPQISLHLDSKRRNWTALHGEGRLLNKTLASVRPMTDLLVRTSVGDCGKWLQQVLCPQDELLSTKAAPATATAPTPSEATTNTHITVILPVILSFSILVGIPVRSKSSQQKRVYFSKLLYVPTDKGSVFRVYNDSCKESGTSTDFTRPTNMWRAIRLIQSSSAYYTYAGLCTPALAHMAHGHVDPTHSELVDWD